MIPGFPIWILIEIVKLLEFGFGVHLLKGTVADWLECSSIERLSNEVVE